jgi:O-antigen ligase
MFAVGSLYTIGQLVQNPTASRLVTTGKYDDLALAGIGEFRFAYAVALLLPWLLVSAVWARRTLLRLVLLLFFAVLALLVYYASFGIAVGLAIAGCLAAGFTRLSRRMPVVLGFAVFVACIAFFLVGGDILASYSRSTNNETLARKADELANVIRRTTTADMDIFKRLDLYHESWATFLNNPLLGAGARYESADALMHGITEHSAWLDTLARFGLFGGLPILILTLTLSNFAYRQWRGTHLGPFVLTMTALVAICGLVNPLLGLAEIGVVIFLVGPAIPRSFGLDLPETANRTAYTGRKNGGCPPRHSGSTL